MITNGNYFTRVDNWRSDNLPDTLKKSHDFVVKITENGMTWNMYDNNEQIIKVVDHTFKNWTSTFCPEMAVFR